MTTLYNLFHSHLGHLTVPLFFCSLITLGLVIEKIVILAIESLKKQTIQNNDPVLSAMLSPGTESLLVAEGLKLLLVHRKEKKPLREEVAEIWLNAQRNKLSSGIRMLQAVALLTPLLGLLGTVLGLIQVFDDLADHRGPIEPALLADGLGLAMYTTAAGLIIALPALAGAHGFQMWIDNIIQRAEHRMNQMNLLMDGVDMSKNHD